MRNSSRNRNFGIISGSALLAGIVAAAVLLAVPSHLTARGRGASAGEVHAGECHEHGFGMGARGDHHDLDTRIEHMKVLLGLSDKQVDKIRPVLEREREKLDELREEIRAERRELHRGGRTAAGERRTARRISRMHSGEDCGRVEHARRRVAGNIRRRHAAISEDAGRIGELLEKGEKLREDTSEKISGILEKDQREKFELLCDMHGPFARHGRGSRRGASEE